MKELLVKGRKENEENLYRIEILFPEEIADAAGFNRITKDLIDTENRVLHTNVMSVVLTNNDPLPTNFNFKINLLKEDRVIQSLRIENSYTP